MARITNTDQVLLLLRSHLQRADRARRPTTTGSSQTPRKSALERARQIVASEEMSDDDVRCALIAGILTEEFGPAFASDARFHDVVKNVVQVISADERSRSLFDQALDQLKSTSS